MHTKTVAIVLIIMMILSITHIVKSRKDSITESGDKTPPPVIIDIPDAYWARGYFEDINSLSAIAPWLPLREVGIQTGDLEIRIWIGFGLDFLTGIRLCRINDAWTGFYIQSGMSVRISEVKPQTDWNVLWKKLETLGILDLPDSSTLPNEELINDGIGYVVEINDGVHYRTYKYSNPQHQKWSEAKQMVEIMKTLYTEFGMDRPVLQPQRGFLL